MTVGSEFFCVMRVIFGGKGAVFAGARVTFGVVSEFRLERAAFAVV